MKDIFVRQARYCMVTNEESMHATLVGDVVAEEPDRLALIFPGKTKPVWFDRSELQNAGLTGYVSTCQQNKVLVVIPEDSNVLYTGGGSIDMLYRGSKGKALFLLRKNSFDYFEWVGNNPTFA